MLLYENMKPINTIKTTLSLLSVSLLLFLFVHMMNTGLIIIGNYVYNTLPFSHDAKNFSTGVLQQAVQALLGLVLGLAVLRRKVNDFGVTLKNIKPSLVYFAIFALSWTIISIAYCILCYFFLPAIWQSMAHTPLPSRSKIFYTLLFQLLFPGIGEELLFRAAFISILAVLLNRTEKNNEFSLPEKNRHIIFSLISAFLFAGAHIYFSTSPFKITHIDPVQQATALVCGFYYAFIYQKTGNLLAPFLCHNFANAIVTVLGWIIALF